MLTIRNHKVAQDGRNVEFIQTPNRSGTFANNSADGIILHDTAGRLEYRGSVNWLTNPKAKASAHFVVGRGGEIVQLAKLNEKTWHAGRSKYKNRSGCNHFTVGIEMANPGKMTKSNSSQAQAWFGQNFDIEAFGIQYAQTSHHGSGFWMPYTDAQIEAVVELCVAIYAAYDMDFITTHWDVSPGRKVDANPLFPLEYVRSRALGRFDGHDGDQAADPDSPRTLANLNHRQWPSFFDNILGVIPRGTEVEVIRSGFFTNNDENELWHLVRHAGEDGWVVARLIENA